MLPATLSAEKNPPVDFQFPNLNGGEAVRPGRGIAWPLAVTSSSKTAAART